MYIIILQLYTKEMKLNTSNMQVFKTSQFYNEFDQQNLSKIIDSASSNQELPLSHQNKQQTQRNIEIKNSQYLEVDPQPTDQRKDSKKLNNFEGKFNKENANQYTKECSYISNDGANKTSNYCDIQLRLSDNIALKKSIENQLSIQPFQMLNEINPKILKDQSNSPLIQNIEKQNEEMLQEKLQSGRQMIQQLKDKENQFGNSLPCFINNQNAIQQIELVQQPKIRCQLAQEKENNIQLSYQRQGISPQKNKQQETCKHKSPNQENLEQYISYESLTQTALHQKGVNNQDYRSALSFGQNISIQREEDAKSSVQLEKQFQSTTSNEQNQNDTKKQISDKVVDQLQSEVNYLLEQNSGEFQYNQNMATLNNQSYQFGKLELQNFLQFPLKNESFILRKHQTMEQQFQIGKEINWDREFYLIYDSYFLVQENSDQQMQICYKLFEYMSQLNVRATEIVKLIIEQLHLTEEQRKYKPQKQQNERKNCLLYQNIEGNFQIKLVYPEYGTFDNYEDILKEDNQNNSIMQGQKLIYKVDEHKKIGYGTRLFIIKFSEYNCLDRLFDAITLQKKMGQLNCCIRVPLACIINYKVYQFLNINCFKGFRAFVITQHNPNYRKCSFDMIPSELQNDLDNILKCLNLKVVLQLKQFDQEFSNEIKISKYQDNMDSQQQTIYYLSDCSSLFPINPETKTQFRAEFTYRCNEPLSNQCQESLITATKFLRTDLIAQLIFQLEQLEILPIDSYSFKQILHLNGINIKYIGLIAHETQFAHIIELCQMEMIARSAKKLFNSFISEYLFQQPDTKQINTITTDFLALVLGQTSKEDTEIFYKQILRPQILHDFHYTLPYPHNIPPGGLYHALFYHCHLNQGNPSPTFIAHSKLFSQRMLPLYSENSSPQSIEGKIVQYKLAKLLNSKEQIPRLITELSSLNFEFEDYSNSQQKAQEALDLLPSTCPFSLKPLILLLKISLKFQSQFEKSLQLFHTYLQVLDYTLGQFHPLHAFIYSTFSDYYMNENQFSDALILKKSQVICCLRILGNTHPVTTQAFLSLADCLFKIGQQDKACAFLEKAFANLINEETINEKQSKIKLATIANQIAASLYNQGKIPESIHYSLKEVELLTQFAEIDNIFINILEAELNIAFSSYLINNYDQSFEHIEKCWLIYDQFKIQDSTYFIKILKVVLLAIFSKLNPSKKECILMFVLLLQEAKQLNYLMVSQFNVEIIPYLQTFCQKLESIITFISNLLYELIKKNTDNLQRNITIPNYNKLFWEKYLKIIEEADPLKIKEYFIHFIFIYSILLLLYALIQTVGVDFFTDNLEAK